MAFLGLWRFRAFGVPGPIDWPRRSLTRGGAESIVLLSKACGITCHETAALASKPVKTEKSMSSKHWLASYGDRIPCEINPHAYSSVVEMLERAMSRFKDKPAFRCFGQTLTYADTDRLSRAFAGFLQQRLSVKKGDRVAVMLPNIPAFAIAMIGILRAGAVQVNVNPLYTARELEHQLNDAGAETIVIF